MPEPVSYNFCVSTAEPVRNSGDNNGVVNSEEEAQRLLNLEFEATDSWRSKSKLPNQSDMLLAFATVPGMI